MVLEEACHAKQLMETMYDWTNINNKGKGQIDVILLDFGKAFDVVPHYRLLMKLHMYGITRKMHRWIVDFQGNRTQEVVVNGSRSERGMAKSGVPQGTVLGPLLFLIYINDIESQITSSIRLFADESALYRPIYSESDSLSLQEDIFKLQKWANTWQMAFNVNKCKLLRSTHRKSGVIKYVYNMYQANPLFDNNSPLLALLAKKHLGFTVPTTDFIHIEETQHESYLGVIIDNKLNFNQHIDDMSKKATNLLNLCRRNLHMCSREAKNSAYNMIVRPHLEYASTCWNPYTKRNIDKLEAVQRRAARIVLNFDDYHPTADLSGKIQKTLQLYSLEHSRAVADLCMFHKLRNNLANIAIPPILVPSVKHNCHHNHIQSLHSDAFKYKCFARGVRLWNIIPYHLITKPSLESIRTATFQWISPLQWYKHPGTNTWCLGFFFVFFCCYFLFVL